jgi:hypothetical protein
MNVVEAMNGPFQPWFQGSSWNAWKAILRAAFCLPMSDSELATFGALAGGRSPPKQRVRELWIIAGRRSGKDSIASLLAAWSAGVEEGHLGRLRPGERASIACYAVDRDQAGIVKNYTQSYFVAVDSLRAKVTRETKVGVELDNSAEIIIATNSFRQARGRSVSMAIFDECAFWMDENSASPDTELYRAIVPSMATLPSSMLIGISSPYRKSGLLYDKWKASFGKDDERTLVIQAASIELNPTLNPAEIAAEIAADPASGMAEWGGQFRNDLSSYVALELIEAAVDDGVAVRPPRPGVRYVGAADVSSGTGRDSYAAAVAHREGDNVILDAVHEIDPPFNPQAATAEVCKLFKSYGIRRCKADKYAAGFAIEAFQRCGVTLDYSERDRSAIYVDCLPLFTAGRARITDDRKLITQWATLERKTSVGGKDTIGHANNPNSHDDRCNAVWPSSRRRGAGVAELPEGFHFVAGGSAAGALLSGAQ